MIRWTVDSFSKAIVEKFPNIQCIDPFVTTKIKLKFSCEDHGVFYSLPRTMLNEKTYYGCPGCRKNNLKYNSNSIHNIIKDVHGNCVSLNEEYTSYFRRYEFICDKGHTWQTYLSNVVSKKSGCAKCHKNSRKLTTEVIDKRIKEIHGNILRRTGAYINATTNCEFTCINGHTWITRPSSVFEGDFCPQCNNKNRFSSMEIKWLEKMKRKKNKNIIINALQKEKIILKLKGYRYIVPDGYDPITKTIYEFHGDYWHGNLRYKPIYKIQGLTKRELNKRTRRREKALLKAGYKVVYCWEKDFKKYLKGRFYFRPLPFTVAKLTKSPYCY